MYALNMHAYNMQQLLADINRSLCDRLDSIESRLETVDQRTRHLEAKVDQFVRHLRNNSGQPSTNQRSGSNKAG